jgi:hypothetical protein
MLDIRYHVASLAAVFFALVIGIVVGIGISGRGFVDKSERQKLDNRIDRLQSRVDELADENDGLREQQQAGRAFVADAYPVLMRGRLAGKRIAVVVIGAAAGSTGSDVSQALSDADGTPARYRAMKLPVQPASVRRALGGIPGFRRLEDAGRELGQEWVTGGKTPVADALTPVVVEEQRGDDGTPVDGVVIVQAETPRNEATRRLVQGLYAGLGSSGVPVVGVEQSTAEPSSVPAFGQYGGFSTVDDVDTPSGRLAIALLLAGAPSGDYGVKETADAPLPAIEQPPGG